MEKPKKSYIVLILVVFFVLFVFCLFQVKCRTVLENLNINNSSIYVPKGVANTYKDLLKLSVDEHIIWEYKLNSKEEKEMLENLNSEIWKNIGTENKFEAMYFFEVNAESHWPKDMSDDLYYCMYDYTAGRFVTFEEALPVLGWHRILFVYDKEHSNYYCVSKSI